MFLAPKIFLGNAPEILDYELQNLVAKKNKCQQNISPFQKLSLLGQLK